MKRLIYIAIPFLSMVFFPSAVSAQRTLANPLTGTGQTIGIVNLVGNFVQALLALAGVLAVAFIIWGAARWAFSRGEASEVQAGKDALMYSILGLIIAFAGFIVTNFIVTRFEGLAIESTSSQQGAGSGATLSPLETELDAFDRLRDLDDGGASDQEFFNARDEEIERLERSGASEEQIEDFIRDTGGV